MLSVVDALGTISSAPAEKRQLEPLISTVPSPERHSPISRQL